MLTLFLPLKSKPAVNNTFNGWDVFLFGGIFPVNDLGLPLASSVNSFRFTLSDHFVAMVAHLLDWTFLHGTRLVQCVLKEMVLKPYSFLPLGSENR